jgi:hypothetical protein
MNQTRWITANGRALWLVLALGFFAPTLLRAATEEKLDELTVGTQTYRNVTVTTKAKDYIFILHSTGMANIRFADLTPEQRLQFGFKPAAEKNTNTFSAGKWASATLNRIHAPQLNQIQSRATQGWTSFQRDWITSWPRFPVRKKLEIIGIGLLAYLFHSFLCLSICRKSGSEPGLIVWIPVLQTFAMLGAAKMSPAWFLAGPVAFLVWSVRICKVRGKSLLTTLCLWFPLTSFFAALYLAFSDRARVQKEPAINVMTLESA